MATRNIVPRANEEGQIGTTLKRWLGGIFKWLNISAYIDFTSTSAPTHFEGRLFYKTDSHTLSAYNDKSDVTVDLGEVSVIRVKNTSGGDIDKGEAVYITGSAAENGRYIPTIALAKADAVATAGVIGLASMDITDGSIGYITQAGRVYGIDTSSFSTGDFIYLSETTAGGYDTSKPDISTVLGYIVYSDASDGVVFINLSLQGAIGADMLKSVYDTNDNGVVDEAESLSEYEIFFGADGDNYGDYSTRDIPTNGLGYFRFHIPTNFSSLTKAVLIGIVTPTAAGVGKDIDLHSDYGAPGETYNNHSESDTTTTYDLSASSNELYEFDISGVLTNIAAGDYCGIQVDHNAIGGSIHYLGVKIIYS